MKADLKRFEDVKRVDQKLVFAAQANWKGIQVAASALHQRYSDYNPYYLTDPTND